LVRDYESRFETVFGYSLHAEYCRSFPTYPTKYLPGSFEGFSLGNDRSCCARKQAAQRQGTASCRSDRQAAYRSNFSLLAIKGRYEYEKVGPLDSFFACC